MTQKEELIRKIQNQRKFLDDLLMDIVCIQEPIAPVEVPKEHRAVPKEYREEPKPEQDRMMKAGDVQDLLNIKPATFYNWIKRGVIPAGENFGHGTRSKRWRFSVICELLEKIKTSKKQGPQKEDTNKRRGRYGVKRS